ncbi:hypothetical protein D3C73_1231180 [compost metagenome]
MALITHVGAVNDIGSAELHPAACFFLNPAPALLLQQSVLRSKLTCGKTPAVLMEGIHKIVAQISHRTAHRAKCSG